MFLLSSAAILLPVRLVLVVVLCLNYRPEPGNSIRGRGINLRALTEVNNTICCGGSSS